MSDKQTLVAAPLYEHFPRPAGTGVEYSYALASTLLAGIGLLLGVVPFALFRYGEQLRKKSKTACALWAAEPGQTLGSASPIIPDKPQATLRLENRKSEASVA